MHAWHREPVQLRSGVLPSQLISSPTHLLTDCVQDAAYWCSWAISHWSSMAVSGVLCALVGLYPFQHSRWVDKAPCNCIVIAPMDVLRDIRPWVCRAFDACCWGSTRLFQHSRRAGKAPAHVPGGTASQDTCLTLLTTGGCALDVFAWAPPCSTASRGEEWRQPEGFRF